MAQWVVGLTRQFGGDQEPCGDAWVLVIFDESAVHQDDPARQGEGGCDAFGDDEHTHITVSAQGAIFEPFEGLDTTRAAADGARQSLHMPQERRANRRAAGLRHGRERMGAQRGGQPQNAQGQHRSDRERQSRTAQTPRFRTAFGERFAHLFNRFDHQFVVDFQRFITAVVGSKDCRHFVRVKPFNRGEGPVGQRPIGRIADDQCGIAKAHSHLAALCLSVGPPQAQTF